MKFMHSVAAPVMPHRRWQLGLLHQVTSRYGQPWREAPSTHRRPPRSLIAAVTADARHSTGCCRAIGSGCSKRLSSAQGGQSRASRPALRSTYGPRYKIPQLAPKSWRDRVAVCTHDRTPAEWYPYDRYRVSSAVNPGIVMAKSLLVPQPHLPFASLIVCASRSGLMASAPA
jgi:hypothetical protein